MNIQNTEHQLTIKKINNTPTEIFVYNMVGSLVKYEKINSTESVDTSFLSNGVYVVKLVEGGSSIAKVLVKK